MLFGALFFALAAGVSCTKEHLDHYKNEGIVEIDLTQADGSPREGKFRVHFYPVSAGSRAAEETEGSESAGTESVPVYRHFDFEGSKFSGRLPVGFYKVLIHNTDTENLALRDAEDYDKATFHVLTGSEAAAAAGKSSEVSRAGECLAQPKNLFVANCAYTESEGGDKERVATLEVAYRGHVKVKSEPKAYVKKVILHFEVEGDDLVALNGGTFTGVSPSHHCASGTCAMTSESVDFETERVYESGSNYTYKAEISVLDLMRPGSSFGTHTVTLNIVPKVGEPYTIEIDVTKFIDEFLREHSGSIPVEVSVEIPVRLEMIDGILSAEIVDWIPGTGGGTIGGDKSDDGVNP